MHVNQRLYRSRDDRMIAGVAGGVADYLGVDPSIVRILWVLLAIFSGGIFLLLYLVMMFVVPEAPAEWPIEESGADTPGETTEATGSASAPPAGGGAGTAGGGAEAGAGTARAARRAARAARRGERREGSGSLILGLILILIGGFFLLRMYVPWLDAGRFWPFLLVIVGLVLILGSIRPGGGGSRD